MSTFVNDRTRKSLSVVGQILLVTVAMVVLATVGKAEPPKAGERAQDFQLAALNGGTVKLSSFLKKGPVVLVILRGYPGYQCPICNMQVGALIGSADKIIDKKAQVILVYPGPADGLKQHANEFVTGKNLPANFTLALDPDYSMIQKYDLRWDAPNETSYPSTFVIDKKANIAFAKVSHDHGNRATPDEILTALASIKARK
ncbi:MAG: peroxiredoxin family protein [Capsulimonas sp.]|uniref:peroxiredoxin family protein n=1 Tax=Capsulimonas sp. TaxID=2494211 RepID=UPI003265FE58